MSAAAPAAAPSPMPRPTAPARRLRPGRARRFARLRRREGREADERVREPQRRQAALARDRRARRRPRVHGARREPARQPGEARRGADEPVVGLHEPVAELDAAHARRGRRPDRHAGQGRQALPPRRVAGALPVRLREAVVPDHRALDARPGRERRGPARADAQEDRLLHAPVHRRDGAVELRADQSRGVPRDGRHRRPEPRARPQQPARRHRARQRPAAHLDDRHEGVRARREHRDDARPGGRADRPDAADPVRAGDEEGAPAAAPRSSRRGSTSTTSSTCARRTRSSAGRWTRA